MRRRIRWSCSLAVASVVCVAPAPPLVAQGRAGTSQSRALFEAATLESNGDLDGAEAALRRVLDLDPTSAGALFALERVLRAKGEIGELRPLVDSFLERTADTEVRALKLELLADADSTQVMVAEAEAWIASDPSEGVFAAVAGVYSHALGSERALDVLKRGRARLGGDALALQTGDVLAASGDFAGAAAEWARAVQDDGSGMEAVRGRLERLGTGRLDAAERVVELLGESSVPERRRATLRLALDMGLEEEALDLAERHAGSLGGRARATFLNEVGIQAREAGMTALVAWAYGELGRDAGSPEERRQFDRRIVDVSLQSGDTVGALQAQRRIADSYSGRSDEWRAAVAESIKMEAAVEPSAVTESWASFREEFPNAPELDGVAAAISASMQGRGDLDGAAAILDGIEGPRTGIERAYLMLGDGDIDGGRAMLLRSVSGLPPAEATPVIQFASLLGRLSATGKQALASAGVEAHRGRGSEAARTLVDAAAEPGVGDAAPLLAEAARFAERAGDADEAAAIRRRLVDDHPDASEAAEATLALARHVARSQSGEEEAIRLLEDLITLRPGAAVVPEARLELERIRNRGS